MTTEKYSLKVGNKSYKIPYIEDIPYRVLEPFQNNEIQYDDGEAIVKHLMSTIFKAGTPAGEALRDLPLAEMAPIINKWAGTTKSKKPANLG